MANGEIIKTKYFQFISPRIYKDKLNKKWFVLYSISYFSDKRGYQRVRCYGKNLNREPCLRQRWKNAEKLRKSIYDTLKKGIDPKNPLRGAALREESITLKNPYTFDHLCKFYCDLKGYTDPKPKQLRSSMNVKRFMEHQFKPFLVSRGLQKDLTLVTKRDVLDFLNGRYLHTNPKKRWSNGTFNNVLQWISTFFQTLIEEDRIGAFNPCKTIKRKPKIGQKRFQIYTKEELKLLDDYLDRVDFNYKVSCQMIRFAYIRATEISRLRVSNIDLPNKLIHVTPDIAKGHQDGLEKDVVIAPDLADSLTKYLEIHEHSEQDYLFGKKLKPCQYPLSLCWHEKFRHYLNDLRREHPDKYDRPGLTMYSLKHSGVSHFVNDNINAKGSLKVLLFVQSQCRHSNLETTQLYLRKLPVSLEEREVYVY